MIRPDSAPGRLLAGLEFRDTKAAGPARSEPDGQFAQAVDTAERFVGLDLAVDLVTGNTVQERVDHGDEHLACQVRPNTPVHPRTHKVHPSSTGHDEKPQLTTPGMR